MIYLLLFFLPAVCFNTENFVRALFNVFAYIVNQPMSCDKKFSYPMRLFLAFDRLGNAVGGGDYRCTISAKTHYNSHAWYWSTMEKVINWAFYPLDGEGHCRQALAWELRFTDAHVSTGNDIFRFISGVIICVSCLFIGMVNYLISICFGNKR